VEESKRKRKAVRNWVLIGAFISSLIAGVLIYRHVQFNRRCSELKLVLQDASVQIKPGLEKVNADFAYDSDSSWLTVQLFYSGTGQVSSGDAKRVEHKLKETPRWLFEMPWEWESSLGPNAHGKLEWIEEARAVAKEAGWRR